MYDECQICESHRNCINGLYCLKLKKYVQYALEKECETPKNNNENKGL